ncbi:hypothetical protein [Candidatus Methanocrinis natronophilus]|uniref:Uncharacterized protein n=1 Tax=Candidatus Methanocrinis natronophilus TaxID=3033396 RepID=A0ABT5X820_9EURY|nr:hypothetical protein [Candidatus Methanocrinis natronophilus]MDF0590803.1 hypothetical protein [Candidatus Methanocrinis natronophilus]
MKGVRTICGGELPDSLEEIDGYEDEEAGEERRGRRSSSEKRGRRDKRLR